VRVCVYCVYVCERVCVCMCVCVRVAQVGGQVVEAAAGLPQQVGRPNAAPVRAHSCGPPGGLRCF